MPKAVPCSVYPSSSSPKREQLAGRGVREVSKRKCRKPYLAVCTQARRLQGVAACKSWRRRKVSTRKCRKKYLAVCTQARRLQSVSCLQVVALEGGVAWFSVAMYPRCVAKQGSCLLGVVPSFTNRCKGAHVVVSASPVWLWLSLLCLSLSCFFPL